MHDPFAAARGTVSGVGPYIVTIGTFDGVHRGHQHLLDTIRRRAIERKLPSLAITFEPLPAQIVRPETYRGRLSSPGHRLDLLRSWSGGEVVVVPFTEEVRLLEARSFVSNLTDFVPVAELWVGEEFALGRDRRGTIAALAKVGEGAGFDVRAAPRLTVDGEVVSSSRIRQLVIDGDVEEAAALLGRPFRVTGTVIQGAQVGRTIGFPTANVEPPEGLVALADGIYASVAVVEREGIGRPAMTYIGTRPALNTGNRLIETHLLDFDGDLYGAVLHTDFIARLRPDATFDSVEALVAQLRIDEIDARLALATRLAPMSLNRRTASS